MAHWVNGSVMVWVPSPDQELPYATGTAEKRKKKGIPIVARWVKQPTECP